MRDLKNSLIICGHRGERVHGIENTITAMRHAMDLGVDMVETDVRMSADGHLFLMHNRNLADCTDGEGRLEDHTRSEILGMNALKNAVRDRGLDIPDFEPPAPFEDFLALAHEYPNVVLNIEFKDLPGLNGVTEDFAFKAVDRAVGMLIEHGLEDRTLINSFSATLVERVYRCHGERFHYHTFYPWENNGGLTIDPTTYCEVVCPLNWVKGPVRKLDQVHMPDSYFGQLSGCGMGIIVSGGSSEEECTILERMVSKGGNILMTDNPERVLKHFRQC